MKDCFNYTREESISLAEKLYPKTIYSLAKIEGVEASLLDIQNILNGHNLSSEIINEHDLEVIINLKSAWNFIIENIDLNLNLEYISHINYYVSMNHSLEWGKLRSGEVGISGVNFRPKVPIEDEVKIEIAKILDSELSTSEKTLRLMLWGCRSQLFWDGNKRTSILTANKLLLSKGKGLLIVNDEYINDFNEMLSDFYETNNYFKATEFLQDKCLVGF